MIFRMCSVTSSTQVLLVQGRTSCGRVDYPSFKSLWEVLDAARGGGNALKGVMRPTMALTLAPAENISFHSMKANLEV